MKTETWLSHLASHSMKRSFHALEGKCHWAGLESRHRCKSVDMFCVLLVKTMLYPTLISRCGGIRKEDLTMPFCTQKQVMNSGHFQSCSIGAPQAFQPPTLLTMFAPSPVCPTQRAVTFSLSSKGFVQWTANGVWNGPCSFQHRESVDSRFHVRRMCTCCMRYV